MFFVSYFVFCVFFFFKQKTAYEMRISDWSSDVCSSDLPLVCRLCDGHIRLLPGKSALKVRFCQDETRVWLEPIRPEEHTSELQSLMSISYAGFCLKKKKYNILIKSTTSFINFRSTTAYHQHIRQSQHSFQT